MFRLCAALVLDLSVTAVAFALAACCLVRDVNDPAERTAPVFSANGHVGGSPRPFPSLAWREERNTSELPQPSPNETRQRFANLRARTPSTTASTTPSDASRWCRSSCFLRASGL